METVRSFISIELPEGIKGELRRLQDNFKKNFPRLKWVSIDSIHLTLIFLGNVTESKLVSIKDVLKSVTQEQPVFGLNLKETGLFPDIKRPRVVWVGLRGDIEILSRIQKLIESGLSPLGFIPEKRSFTPHLTLARMPEGTSPSELREFVKKWMSVQAESSHNFEVKSINLMKSTLMPTGAVYNTLASFQLKKFVNEHKPL